MWDQQFTGKRWSSFVCQLEKHTRNLSCSGMPELSLSSVETVQVHAQTLWHWYFFFFSQISVSLQKSKVFLIIYLNNTYMWPVSRKKKNHKNHRQMWKSGCTKYWLRKTISSFIWSFPLHLILILEFSYRELPCKLTVKLDTCLNIVKCTHGSVS